MRHWQTTSSLTCRSAAVVIALAASVACHAGSLSVAVTGQDGSPVADVAVYAVPDSAAPAVDADPPHAFMDQVDFEFVPHILVAQSGTVVEFPNSDNVNHHVYSFSPAKSFELPLYKGSVYPPLIFDEAGVVTLGCNIHDNMLGYVLVVDTPWFTKTDKAGSAMLQSLPEGRYRIHAWTPRISEANLPASQAIELRANGDAALTFRFEDKLYPPHRQDSNLTWSAY